MNLSFIILNTVEILGLPVIIFIFALPKMFRYIKRSRGTFIRRFYLPSSFLSATGGYWFQASSVGEVKIAVALAGRLKKAAVPLYLFAMTPEGRKLGKETGVFDGCFMAPADIFFIVRSFLAKVRPRLLILIELQLWPNLVDQASRFTKIVLVNGRISDKSFAKYKLIKCFTRMLFKKISFISARTKKDALRFASLGAAREKIRITGNIKYDILTSSASFAVSRREYSIQEHSFVITAGSTHGEEEEMIVQAVSLLPSGEGGENTLCIIAPRHTERVGEIEKMLKKRNLAYSLFSRRRGIKQGDNFLIVDVFGILADMYQIADVCFVGGSLVPHGGQNFVEAVNKRKAVVVGPFNSNFQHEFDILKSEMLVVNDADSLKKAFEKLMRSPSEREKLAALSYEKLKTLTGALDRNVRIIAGV